MIFIPIYVEFHVLSLKAIDTPVCADFAWLPVYRQ